MYIDDETRVKAEKLYNDNIKMSTHYAKKFAGYIKFGVIEYDDLIQTAQLSLWKACLTFDDTKGHKFFTYASRCLMNDLILFKNKSFKEDHEDYISYNNDISGEEGESTFLDILLGEEGIDESVQSNIFIKDSMENLKDYYKFEGKDELAEIVDNIIKGYTIDELIEIFNYDRKHIKSCYELIKYLLEKEPGLYDVLSVKVEIYRNHKDFVVKAKRALKEYNSKDSSRESFTYKDNAELAFKKLKDSGYDTLVNSLRRDNNGNK